MTNLVFYHLAFAELFNRGTLDLGVMEKQIAPFAIDESKTLFR